MVIEGDTTRPSTSDLNKIIHNNSNIKLSKKNPLKLLIIITFHLRLQIINAYQEF